MPKFYFIALSQKRPGTIDRIHGKTPTKWSVCGKIRNIRKHNNLKKRRGRWKWRKRR
jgi:hypothetical protein